jgi:hypothetical protein
MRRKSKRELKRAVAALEATTATDGRLTDAEHGVNSEFVTYERQDECQTESALFHIYDANGDFVGTDDSI